MTSNNRTIRRIVLGGVLVCLLYAYNAFATEPKAETKHVLFWQGSFESAWAMAAQLHKPMMLSFNMPNDFEHQLDTITYHDPRVVYFVGATCLAYRIDGDTRDTALQAIIKQYKVQFYPTVIVTKSNGEEIDRMVGYYPPKQFLFYLQNFINDTNTIGSLRKRHFADTTNANIAFQLASRFELRVELDSAMHYFAVVLRHGQESSALVQEAKFRIGVFSLKVFANAGPLNEVIATTPFDSLRYNGYHELISFYEQRKYRDSMFATYDHAVRAYPRDAALLNDFAWQLAVRGGDLDTAEIYARRAIELAPSVSDYYDTMAEIYFRRRNYQKALVQIEKALQLKKNDPYLKHREKVCRDELAKGASTLNNK